jgi:hypothetical protein
LSTTTFQVGAGQVRDSTNTFDIVIGANTYANTNAESGSPATSAAVTVNLAVTGINGVDTGTIAASKSYSVFAVGSSTGQVSGGAVISLVAPTGTPNLPLNCDCYRYIGSISTDGSSQVRKFIQTGSQSLRTMWFDPGTGPGTNGVVIPSSGTAGSTTYVNVGVFTTLIPQTALEVLLKVALTPNAANDVIYLGPATIDNGTTATVGSVTSLSAAVTGSAQVATVRVPVALPNAAQQAALTIGNVVTALYATTSASDTVVFLLQGYIDQL